jgi:hypothetical protein
MKNSSSKLINILIGKAILETLLVSVVAVGSYIMLFPPTFHGWGEALSDSQSIVGWAVNDSSSWERVEVQLFVDDKFVATQIASLSRPDVTSAGWAKDEWHGYSFQLSGAGPGPHQARVYALHPCGAGVRYTLQLLGEPIIFRVEPNGAWRPVVEAEKSGLH